MARAIPERGKRQRAAVAEVAASPPNPRRQRLLRDIALILIAPLLLYLWICLFTYSPDDPGWSTSSGTGVTGELGNAGGLIGAWVADVLLGLTGYVAYLLPLVLGAVAWIALFGMDSDGDGRVDFGPALRLMGIVGFLVSATGLLYLRMASVEGLPQGGMPLEAVDGLFSAALVSPGAPVELALAPGRYRVTVAHDGQERSSWIAIAPDSPTTLTFRP